MSFNRLSSNRWYANIDDYPGDFEDLEMVMGADELLDRLSCGEDFVKVSIYFLHNYHLYYYTLF